MQIISKSKNDFPQNIDSKIIKKVMETATSKYGIPKVVLLENKARAIFLLIKNILGDDLSKENICILAGTGEKALETIITARYLANANANVSILLIESFEDQTKEIQAQLKVLKLIGVQYNDIDSMDLTILLNTIFSVDLILDGMIGNGLKGQIKEPLSDIMEFINQSKAFRLSNNLPTGINLDKGILSDFSINANATIVSTLLHKNLFQKDIQPTLGLLFLADIGIPKFVYEDLNIKMSDVFAGEAIVQIKE